MLTRVVSVDKQATHELREHFASSTLRRPRVGKPSGSALEVAGGTEGRSGRETALFSPIVKWRDSPFLLTDSRFLSFFARLHDAQS